MTAAAWARCLALVLAALLVRVPVAGAAPLSCTEAAALAEAGEAIPPGLLLAIGQVESGRATLSGARVPWPWTINAGGVGRFFAAADEAVAAVRQLQAEGVQSIDVGCFQVNLLYHPEAFATLEDGFDPMSNALAAARFLAALHAELGAWEPAVAAYHSRLDTLGAPYRDQVLAAWHGTLPPPGPRTGGGMSLQGWYRRPGAPVPAVRVWGPGGLRDPGAAVVPVALPRVVTPSGR